MTGYSHPLASAQLNDPSSPRPTIGLLRLSDGLPNHTDRRIIILNGCCHSSRPRLLDHWTYLGGNGRQLWISALMQLSTSLPILPTVISLQNPRRKFPPLPPEVQPGSGLFGNEPLAMPQELDDLQNRHLLPVANPSNLNRARSFTVTEYGTGTKDVPLLSRRRQG